MEFGSLKCETLEFRDGHQLRCGYVWFCSSLGVFVFPGPMRRFNAKRPRFSVQRSRLTVRDSISNLPGSALIAVGPRLNVQGSTPRALGPMYKNHGSEIRGAEIKFQCLMFKVQRPRPNVPVQMSQVRCSWFIVQGSMYKSPPIDKKIKVRTPWVGNQGSIITVPKSVRKVQRSTFNVQGARVEVQGSVFNVQGSENKVQS